MEPNYFYDSFWFLSNETENYTYSYNTTIYDFGSLRNNANILPNQLVVLIAVLYGFIFIIGLTGNICTCCYLCFSKKGKTKTIGNFFMMTIAINDILVITFCIPFIKLNKLFFDSWKFGTVFCGIVGYLQWVLILQKSFNIVVIICDRHFIVARPLKQRLSKRTSQFIIFGTYVLAAAIALPTALHTQVVDVSFGTNSSRICTELWSSIESKLAYTYSLMSLHFFIPLILMVISSLHIAYILLTRQIPGEVDKRRQEVIKSSKHKSVKVLVFMAITFAVSWLPLAVLTFIADDMSKSPNMGMLLIICEMLTFMNCITIPVLYFWTNRRYREVLGEFSMKITGHYHIKFSVVHRSQSKNSNCSMKSNSSVEMNNFLSNIH